LLATVAIWVVVSVVVLPPFVAATVSGTNPERQSLFLVRVNPTEHVSHENGAEQLEQSLAQTKEVRGEELGNNYLARRVYC